MPSDHSSIAARHRARTLSRAKSVRKHERWLVQQHDRHQSQPNLHTTDLDKQQFGESLLRRATSFRSQRNRGLSTTDATGLEKKQVSPCASSTGLINSVYPFSPLIAVSNAGSGFPWNEVNWNRSRRKLGLSSSIERLLTPYPATTTRQVSKATANCTTMFTAGELDATAILGQIRRKYSPRKNDASSKADTASATCARSRASQQHSQARTLSLDSTSTLTTTDSNTTSSSQWSDSDALMHLYAATVSTNARSRPNALLRAQTYSHPSRDVVSAREEREPLLLPRPQLSSRDKSPQRHQRDRHPQLVFPYAPGATGSAASHRDSYSRSLVQHDHHPREKAKGSTVRVRRFINGYWRYVSIPHSSQHQALPTSSEADDGGAGSDETTHFIPGKTIWSRTRSSISSLTLSANLRVGFVADKVKFWSSGARRLL